MQRIKELVHLRQVIKDIQLDMEDTKEDLRIILTDMAINENIIEQAIIESKVIISHIRRLGEGIDRILIREMIEISGINEDNEDNEKDFKEDSLIDK